MPAHLITIKILVAPIGDYGSKAPLAQISQERQVYLDPLASYNQVTLLDADVRNAARDAAVAIYNQLVAAFIEAGGEAGHEEATGLIQAPPPLPLSGSLNDGEPEPGESPSDEPASSEATTEAAEPDPWDRPAIPATPDEEVLEHGA